MNLRIECTLLALFIAFSTTAQTKGGNTARVETPTIKRCVTPAPSPDWEAWFSVKVAEYAQQKKSPTDPSLNFVIPVIVHVIHGGEAISTFPNVSAAQIYSQLNVLNADYGGTGLGSANLAATGFSLVGAANTKITFCPAQIDPQGNPLSEPGIDRVNYKSKGWADPASLGSVSGFQILIENTIKPATIWDPRLFFNIWISDANTSLYTLGYATFPAGSGLIGVSSGIGGPTNDGIWIWTKTFGNTGTLHSVYNKGRSAVHETGHWLGLRHIGGDAGNASGDCNATDYCNDTPAQKGGAFGGTNGQNFGAPTYPLHVNACTSQYGDMFMNFMDYTDDAVMSMFTPDQGIRMQTAMTNGTYRSLLSASSATQCTVNFLSVSDRAGGSPALSVSPNPASGSLQIKYETDAQGDLQLFFHNSYGQELEAVQLTTDPTHSFFLDLKNYPEGLYFITLKKGNEKTVKRVIISR